MSKGSTVLKVGGTGGESVIVLIEDIIATRTRLRAYEVLSISSLRTGGVVQRLPIAFYLLVIHDCEHCSLRGPALSSIADQIRRRAGRLQIPVNSTVTGFLGIEALPGRFESAFAPSLFASSKT